MRNGVAYRAAILALTAHVVLSLEKRTIPVVSLRVYTPRIYIYIERE